MGLGDLFRLLIKGSGHVPSRSEEESDPRRRVETGCTSSGTGTRDQDVLRFPPGATGVDVGSKSLRYTGSTDVHWTVDPSPSVTR